MTHDSPSVATRDVTSRNRVFASVSVTSFAAPEEFTAAEFGLGTISEMDVVGGDSEPGLYHDGGGTIAGGTDGASFNNLKLVVWE